MSMFYGFLIFIFSIANPKYVDKINCPTEMDRLAIETLIRINPVSIKHNWEYGGTIYLKNGGKLDATPPMTDSLPHNVTINSLYALGIKGVPVAFYHTHAAKSTDYVDEEFSEIDTTNAVIDQYLMTPGNNIFKFDHSNRRVYRYDRKGDVWTIVPIKPVVTDSAVFPIIPRLQLYDKIPYQILNQ